METTLGSEYRASELRIIGSCLVPRPGRSTWLDELVANQLGLGKQVHYK